MDSALAADVRARFEYERSRTRTPDGYPQLPDIPLARYTDEAIYKAEIAKVFRKTWQFAGHESQWDKPGSYRLLDLPFAPVVVTRGKDGELRAFLNSCRHRGAPVVRERSGETKLFVCQFHSWAYDLDGALVRVQAERNFNGICKEERGLPNVRCETWAGFVFVNLDPDAIPVQEWLAPFDRRYRDLLDAPYRHVTSRSYEFACNSRTETFPQFTAFPSL
jgi:phenylpropionate dioxygenase-like ring-hydroxylating dioxygenase large terminal subunit